MELQFFFFGTKWSYKFVVLVVVANLCLGSLHMGWQREEEGRSGGGAGHGHCGERGESREG